MLRQETQAAIDVVRIAQSIADSRTGASEIQSKGGIDLVTATDVAVEDRIRAELTAAFPEYSVIGEERAGAASAGKPYWLVDPICGTRPFASNIPLYCTNVALVENGEVTVAAIGIGRTGEVMFAEKGRGAFLRTSTVEQQIRVSDQSNTIWIDGKDATRTANAAHRALLSRRWYVWLYSSSVAYAHLASGRISGILHFGMPTAVRHGSVHTAAGCYVAMEAGAIVMDLSNGRAWTLETRALLLAATPQLRDELLEIAAVPA